MKNYLQKPVSIVACIVLAISTLFVISHKTSASALIPQMPLGSTDYITPSTQMTSTTATWVNGVLSTGVSAGSSVYSESIFDVTGISASDDYVISFYSKLADLTNAYTGGIGIKLGENELTFRAGNRIFILSPTGTILHEYRYGTGTTITADTFFKVDVRLRPSATSGKTDMSIDVNGISAVYGSDYTWRTTIAYPEIIPTFKFVSSNWNANTEFRGIRVYKVDPSATEFEPINTTDEELPEIGDHAVSLQKSGEDFVVGITNWQADHQYQIWTYQKITTGVFGTDYNEEQNQWILSKPYTLGSERSTDPDPDFGGRPAGFTESEGVLQANIGPFLSVDSNYTVAVKVIDSSGNFVGQYKETFTPAEANVAGISKVTVDGQFADEKAFVKDIASGSPVQFVVTGNGATGTVFMAKVDQKPEVVLSTSGAGNEFSWDISTMAPGDYSVTLTASAGASSDSRTVNFKLYDSTVAAAAYGVVGGAVAATAGTATETHFTIDVDAAGVTGNWFRYRISEPWGATIRMSSQIDASGGTIDETDEDSILLGKYGVYQVTGYTYRNEALSSADDGFVRTVNYARPEGATLDVTVNGTPAGIGVIAGNKSASLLIAGLTNIPSPEYSFWRRDANGWVMIRDWAASGEITWTPNRVGLYTIQVRAKESGGLTYEVLKNIEFDITYAGESRAVVTGITINQDTLDSDASARTPITITANAVSASEDLLYKFIISNGYIYYVETAYSADPTYMWVPGKAGDYTINVLVKNQASFGKYDAVGSFVVNVN